MIGGRREDTKDYAVPRSFKSPVLVGVDSFTYRKICVAVQKSIKHIFVTVAASFGYGHVCVDLNH